MNRLKYAVPCVVLVDATSEEDAYEKVNLHIQHSPTLPRGMAVLLDEELDAFPYDSDKCEVHSANDRDDAIASAKAAGAAA